MRKSTITKTAVYLTALLAAGLTCANAATSAVGGSASGNELSSFESMFGVPVVQTGKTLPLASNLRGAPSVRLSSVQVIAADKGLTWQKVYQISPAGIGAPVTTLADAEKLADESGSVSLSVSGMPASKVIATIAAADNATVEYMARIGEVGINAGLSDQTIAQAIAALAAATQTHWSVLYVIGPAGDETNVAQSLPNEEMASGVTTTFNGPILVHLSPVDPETNGNMDIGTGPVSAATAAAPAEVAPGATAQSQPVPNANTTAQYPGTYGAMAPYGYGGNYNAPQPYQAAPGMVVQPGNPWGNSTIVFGSNGANGY